MTFPPPAAPAGGAPTAFWMRFLLASPPGGPKKRSDNQFYVFEHFNLTNRIFSVTIHLMAAFPREVVMFVRVVKVRSARGVVHEYVRVVEAYRDQGKNRQRVVSQLGRLDVLRKIMPSLERVVRGMPKVEGEDQSLVILQSACWGPMLVIAKLFDKLGLWSILDHLLDVPKKKDAVSWTDRVFVLVANRLLHPHSEHALARWLETHYVCDRLGRRILPDWQNNQRVKVGARQLQNWYRTLDRLVAHKNAIELALYKQLCDLFSLQPELVLYDITSTYFEGNGPPEFAAYGHSRDHRKQNRQVIVGVVMVGGWPITHHVWAGNRIDKSTVQEMLEDLTKRFSFKRFTLVGDRGMISAANLKFLTDQNQGYLLGVQRRRNPRFQQWLDLLKEDNWRECRVGISASEKKPIPKNLVQEVASGVEGQRVLIIHSQERQSYEEAMRQRCMEKTCVRLKKLQTRITEEKIKDPNKINAAAQRILDKNYGSRYYRFGWRAEQFYYEENQERLAEEKRLEGKYVMVTNEKNLDIVEAVAQYKELMEVERGFRSLKDVLQMRPIYHRTEPRVRAHIFVAALALLVERALENQLKERAPNLSTAEALESLQTVQAVEFQIEGHGRRLGVSVGSPRARQVLAAMGITAVRPPCANAPAAPL